VGFPLALIIAWAFELTPEGIKRETAVDPAESITDVTGRKLDFAIITLLVLAVVFLVVDNYVLEPEPHPLVEAHRDAIAIMTITPTEEIDLNLGRYARGTLFAHLSEFAGGDFRVKAQEMIDWKQAVTGVDDFEIARSLRLKWMISGSLEAFGDLLILRLNVVDTPTGELRETIEKRARRDDFSGFERIVNEASVRLLEVLKVEVPMADRRRLLSETSGASGETASDFLETIGFAGRVEPVSFPFEEPQSNLRWSLVNAAHAAESEPTKQEVLDLIERYRLAIQSKEIEGLAALHINLPQQLRAAFDRYFGNARNLVVTFANIEVEFSGGNALATFTRRDEFEDGRTGQAATMEFRVTSVCERTSDGWKIRGLLKPS
jgi:ketosteroid isomerase-like protein